LLSGDFSYGYSTGILDGESGMKSSSKFDLGIAYPPHTEKKLAFVKKALK
jgi:hypothetical protein